MEEDEEKFQFLLNSIDRSYRRRKQEQQFIWHGFDNRVRELTDLVSSEFRKVLDEIGPVVTGWYDSNGYNDRAIIEDFKVIYEPESKKLSIKIEKIKSTKGNNAECPHIYLDPITGFFEDELDKRILEFIKKYNIEHIENPDNHCNHK